MRALVVEDDTGLVEVISDILDEQGYIVDTAVGGEAIPLARELRPDIILLDLNMPGMDGLEVAWRIREHPGTRHIPIVLMSAAYRLREQGIDAPINAMLAKPFELDELVETVNMLATGESGEGALP